MSDSSLKLARRCGVKIEGALRLLCSDRYTDKLQEKSHDSRIERGDYYGIYFLDKQPSVYIVLFHNRPIQHCLTLWPTSGAEFRCFDGIDKNSTLVSLGKTDYVTCLQHQSTYTNNLLEACGVRSSGPHPLVTVMHYRSVEDTQIAAASSASALFQWECLLVLLILSVFLCLLFRFRH